MERGNNHEVEKSCYLFVPVLFRVGVGVSHAHWHARLKKPAKNERFRSYCYANLLPMAPHACCAPRHFLFLITRAGGWIIVDKLKLVHNL